jgi:hypothetical protein
MAQKRGSCGAKLCTGSYRQPREYATDGGQNQPPNEVRPFITVRYTGVFAQHSASRYRVGDNDVRVGWLPVDI